MNVVGIVLAVVAGLIALAVAIMPESLPGGAVRALAAAVCLLVAAIIFWGVLSKAA